MPDLRRLRSFVALVELGGFTRAARQLDLTQAAISQHIAHLEREFGPLLVRRPRQIELTPAGEALREYCHELERIDKRLKLRLSDTTPDSGDISVISPGSIGLALYAALLDLQQIHRGLVIRHRFAPDPEILDAVLRKQYELGVVTLKPDDVRLQAVPFVEEPLELVVPAGVEVSNWHDLEQMGFIDHPDGQAMGTRLLARRFPGNPGIRSVPFHGFVNQITLILEPVARGLGFTVMPRHARQAFSRPEAIRVIACDPPVVDTLWLVYRAEWPLSARAAWVLEKLRHLPSLMSSGG